MFDRVKKKCHRLPEVVNNMISKRQQVSIHTASEAPAEERGCRAAGPSLHLIAGDGATVGILPQEAEPPGFTVIFVLRALLVVICLLFS